MKVLSIATVFPNPAERGLGLFTAARLEALARIEHIKVIAPVAPFDYDNPGRTGIGKRSTPRRRMEGALEVFHPAWGYPPGSPPIKGRLLALQLYPLLRRVRKEFPFDFIDAQFCHPEGVAARILARWFGCSYSVTMHGNELYFSKSRGTRGAMQKALRDASTVLAVSSELRTLAVELGASPERVRVVGNGIDPKIHRVYGMPQPLPGRPVRILTAGRLIALKGFDRIIRSVAALRDAGHDLELTIAGGSDRSLPSCRSELESLANDLDVASRVHFLGPIAPAQLAQRMSESDVFCLASSREGWPSVVHEALACGCPIVATDVGEVRQLIPDERAGLVVPVGDSAALTAALLRAATMQWDRQAIADRAARRTWDVVAAEAASAWQVRPRAGR